MTEYIELSDQVELVPVLDVSLWNFVDKPEEISLTGEIPVSAEERYKWWKRGFSSLGITDLEPVPGTATSLPLVAVESLTNLETLTKLTQAALAEKKRQGFLDVWLEEITPSEFTPDNIFEGGYLFTHVGETIFGLMCCTDFANIDSWKEAIAYRSEQWQMHWIGHPWSMVRYMDANLQFTEPAESSKVENPTKIYVVDPASLSLAVAKAERIYQDFEQRFRQVIATLVF